MAKRVISGVEKNIKKPLIRRRLKKKKKKSLLNKVLDYLKSDSYMYAPLISHYPCDYLASNVVVSSSITPGVEINREGNNNKGLVEKVGNYLNSDSHLYAPLFAPPKGEHIKGVRIELSKKKIILEKGSERTVEKSNITVVEKVNGEDDDVPAETRNRRRRSNLGQEEKGTVKHMVYQSCRTSSMSEKRLIDPRLRMFLKKYLME